LTRRLLITGSRDWRDVAAIENALAAAWREWDCPGDAVLVHGACPTGADRIADRLWRVRGFRVDRWPADWRRFGKRAGPLRNEQMVDRGADLCLAFIGPCAKPDCPEPRPHGSHGARHCADYAEAAGIEVRRIPLSP
jgi:hypothetical protein